MRFHRSVLTATFLLGCTLFSASAGAEERFPTLTTALKLARERAPEVLRAELEVEASKGRFVGARLNPLTNPYLELWVDRGAQGVTKDVTVQANLWLPVEVSGQRPQRLAEAEAFTKLKKGNAEANRAYAAGAAARLYGQAVVASAGVRTFAALAELARKQAQTFEERLTRGDATLQDTAIARVELTTREVIVTEARSDLIRALTSLAQATGAEELAEPAGESPAPPAARRVPRSRRQALDIAARSPLLQRSKLESRYWAQAAELATVEATAPFNFIVTGGRGDFGEARLGGALAWTFPMLRTGQGEKAKALAEQKRAVGEGALQLRVITAAILGAYRELQQLRLATEQLEREGVPAARNAVVAARETFTAGKGLMLTVLTAQRDLASLETRRLDLLRKEWDVYGRLVELTGDTP